MLKQLIIQNLAIVESLEIEFEAGMTALTGETGAGKSIIIDALELCLGGRADPSLVRPGTQSATVAALFHIDVKHPAWTLLLEKSLENSEGTEESVKECILRRVVGLDGRSRAYINGQLATAAELKSLGERLLNIHGQHQNQALLKTEYQRELLDEFAQNSVLREKTAVAYRALLDLQKEKELLSNLEEKQGKLELLQYHAQEFDELSLLPSELETLENDHRKLSHASLWLELSQQVLHFLSNDEINDTATMNAEEVLERALQPLQQLEQQFKNLSDCREMLNTALIQIQEAKAALMAFREDLMIDPERLAEIDARLGKIHTLARKHKIKPQEIIAKREQLHDEIAQILNAQSALELMDEKIEQARSHYFAIAKQLSAIRSQATRDLTPLITEKLHDLEMKQGKFEIKMEPTDEPRSYGAEEVEFLVSVNPGHPVQPIRKIASGGEMSRISLAIQVITAEKTTIPCLVFDEVDVGISGKTAEIVGNLLCDLGLHAQVICITHLPQVAAKAHHHYRVEKRQQQEHTSSTITRLNEKARVEEIARLLGGIHITENTLAHAREMVRNRSRVQAGLIGQQCPQTP